MSSSGYPSSSGQMTPYRVSTSLCSSSNSEASQPAMVSALHGLPSGCCALWPLQHLAQDATHPGARIPSLRNHPHITTAASRSVGTRLVLLLLLPQPQNLVVYSTTSCLTCVSRLSVCHSHPPTVGFFSQFWCLWLVSLLHVKKKKKRKTCVLHANRYDPTPHSSILPSKALSYDSIISSQSKQRKLITFLLLLYCYVVVKTFLSDLSVCFMDIFFFFSERTQPQEFSQSIFYFLI